MAAFGGSQCGHGAERDSDSETEIENGLSVKVGTTGKRTEEV
jgi:hypothetical protein